MLLAAAQHSLAADSELLDILLKNAVLTQAQDESPMYAGRLQWDLSV